MTTKIINSKKIEIQHIKNFHESRFATQEVLA